MLCFHCNQPGHLIRDCGALKDKKKAAYQSSGNPLELSLSLISSIYIKPNSWWADSGATVHVSNQLQGFEGLRRIDDGKSLIYMGNNDRAAVEGIGNWILNLDSGIKLILEECLYAPTVRRNLFSISRLEKCGFEFDFGNGRFLMSLNGDVVLSGFRYNDMYKIHLNGNEIYNVEKSCMNQTYL